MVQRASVARHFPPETNKMDQRVRIARHLTNEMDQRARSARHFPPETNKMDQRISITRHFAPKMDQRVSRIARHLKTKWINELPLLAISHSKPTNGSTS